MRGLRNAVGWRSDVVAGESADLCQDCDERCSPYCINRCEYNHSYYGCSDCYDYRTSFCFQECEYNEGYELVHPCDECQRSECTPRCPYYEKRQAQQSN